MLKFFLLIYNYKNFYLVIGKDKSVRCHLSLFFCFNQTLLFL